MHIVSLDYKGWRGASFRLSFAPRVTAIVGMNGCGKTNAMELLALLTGHDKTQTLIRPREELEYARVEVRTGNRKFVLELDGLDIDKIEAFKKSLPHRTSFVLQQDSIHDDRFVTQRRRPVECQKDMLEWLTAHGLGLNFYFSEGKGASLLVSETGAQRNLLTVGMRRAPTHVPMIAEHPERSLHVMLKRTLPDFYLESTKQQLILTTHDPEILSGIRGFDDDMYWKSKSLGMPPRKGNNIHCWCIDMHSEEVKW